ncbi:TIGR02757 family protein [Candidatus Fermentibacteria bacterium]|nr:MAG: TIGR02757 family protein [Candidatus Fermentibacteria bacterium]
MPPLKLRERLENAYNKYNRREFIHPDPLEFLWRYSSTVDREIAGLIASGLAYGRVAQILKSTEKVLAVLGPAPSAFLKDVSSRDLSSALAGSKHRFTTSIEMAALLKSASRLQEKWGLFGRMLGVFISEDTYHNALDRFVKNLLEGAGMEKCSMLPRPSLGSACKRLHLFMRWMIRKDEVDPGGWEWISPSVLLVPLDVHMFRAAGALGFTCRKTASRAAALEITENFRMMNPDDPVKYDFAITRMGIQGLHEDIIFRELFS